MSRMKLYSALVLGNSNINYVALTTECYHGNMTDSELPNTKMSSFICDIFFKYLSN